MRRGVCSLLLIHRSKCENLHAVQRYFYSVWLSNRRKVLVCCMSRAMHSPRLDGPAFQAACEAVGEQESHGVEPLSQKLATREEVACVCALGAEKSSTKTSRRSSRSAPGRPRWLEKSRTKTGDARDLSIPCRDPKLGSDFRCTHYSTAGSRAAVPPPRRHRGGERERKTRGNQQGGAKAKISRGVAPEEKDAAVPNEMDPMGMNEWAAKGDNIWCALLLEHSRIEGGRAGGGKRERKEET